MHKQRKLMLITAGIGAISMFLPWVQIFIISVNGMHGIGILVFLCFLACGIIAIMGDQAKALDKTMWMISIIVAGLAAAIMLILFLRDISNAGVFGYGFYMALLSSIALLYVVFAFRVSGYTLKDGFESLKSSVGKTTDPPSSHDN